MIVPLVQELVPTGSVVDVGCGVGAWLAVFERLGTKTLLALDGPWVPRPSLLIPEASFEVVDLREALDVGRTFDLAVSLEVAEHLPHASAGTLVRSLTSLSPVVLFSAAIPRQGGLGHVNEQWPEYWRDLFRDEGFDAIDCIRPQVWNNRDVCWWFAQNTLLYAREDVVKASAALSAARARTRDSQLSLVHPKLWSARSGSLVRTVKARVRDGLARMLNRRRSPAE